MHIPDGFLSNPIALTLDGLSGATVLYAARRLRPDQSGRIVPVMGVLAAFVFAAQLLNFPVLGGTSGHLVGGALLAVLLGPMAGLLTMATVILAQALILQDGGLIAAGANVFNIGTLATFSGYGVFRALRGADPRRLAFASFFAGWVSMVLSAAACALELALSGAIPLRLGLPAMVGYHAVIGIGEGALTAAILSFLSRARPDLIRSAFNWRFGAADWIGAAALVALPLSVLALAGSSGLPDPLQKLLSSVPSLEPATSASHELGSPVRYSDYPLGIGILTVIAATVFFVNRLARIKRTRP